MNLDGPKINMALRILANLFVNSAKEKNMF